MYFKEYSDETRRWDSVLSLLSEANQEAHNIIEELRANLDEARERIEELEDELDVLRAHTS